MTIPSAWGSRRDASTPLGRTQGRWLLFASVLLALSCLVSGVWIWSARGPQAPVTIFQGVIYGAERLVPSPEGKGLLHWVTIDLNAPGLELFVTPLDPAAVAQGWQYRLQWIRDVVDSERLSVAINGMMFSSNSFGKLRLPGDLARGVETAVAEHVVSHVWEHNYLLWFDETLTPHMAQSKPPLATDLARAKWAVGSMDVSLRNGIVLPTADRNPDSRTAVAVDQQRKFLFLAVGEFISPRLILQKLAELGGREGMLLDGGGSSSIALGRDASGVAPGVLFGGFRAVATYFGVRAKPILLHGPKTFRDP